MKITVNCSLNQVQASEMGKHFLNLLFFFALSDGRVVMVEFIDESGTVVSPTSGAFVNVSLPVAVAITLSSTCSGNTLALSSDPASYNFGLPISCQVSVVLTYAGKPKGFVFENFGRCKF